MHHAAHSFVRPCFDTMMMSTFLTKLLAGGTPWLALALGLVLSTFSAAAVKPA